MADIQMDVDGETPTSGDMGPFGLSKVEWEFYQFVQSKDQGCSLQDRPETMGPAEASMAMNALLRKNAIEIMRLHGENMLRAIDLQEAEKASKLNEAERLVYNAIRSAGNHGIWTKDIQKKTNLKNNLNRALKSLEHKQQIKAVKHVKYPTRKIYMLYDLTPSSDVTGGVWYTDQELDTDFINRLKKTCLKFITARSFPTREDIPWDSIYSADYDHYPTARQVQQYITDSGISTINLTVSDITSLLNVLVYDGDIEKRLPHATMDDESDDDDGDGDSLLACRYKAVRKARAYLTSEALSETPCGKCTVFSFCTDDGPISPSNCEYYKVWLDW